MQADSLSLLANVTELLASDIQAESLLLLTNVTELLAKFNEDDEEVVNAKAKVVQAEANKNTKKAASVALDEAAEAGPSSTPPGPVHQP